MKRSRPGLCFGEVQALCFVFVAVVGIEVEVGDDPHRSIRKRVESVSLEKRVADLFDGVKIELVGKVALDGIGVW